MAYNTWTEGDVLYASDLNENFTLITAVLHSITGGQMAADAINAGTIIDVDVVDETHLDYADTVNGVRCLQIGKETGAQQQLMLKGTALIPVTAATVGTVIFTYANGDLATGDPSFNAAPHIYATAVTDDAAYVVAISVAGTQSCLIAAGPSGGGDVVATQVINIMVIGDF